MPLTSARLLALCALSLATPLGAEPLAEMAGDWRGAGWAKQTPEGPQETVRCRITNIYAAGTLTVAGQCAVPGRQLAMQGRLNGTAGAERITGRWSNPDGIGSAAIVGLQRDNIVAFNFAATDLATGRNLAQNVEWRIDGDTLRLRSTDRTDPSIAMSDITFTR